MSILYFITQKIFEVVRRVMNAKSKFRAIGRGAVKSEKFTNLLAKMTSEAEENKRKKEIAEQVQVNLLNFR